MNAPRNHSPLDALRAVDPLQTVDLDAMDVTGFDSMKEAIVMTGGTGRPSQRRRRAWVAGGLALTLLGGGAAYASYDNWYQGGGADGVNCLTTWEDPLDGQPTASGGPALSADPVADCQEYQRLTDGAPISDPVAFSYNGQTFVTPRQQVPDLEGVSILSAPTIEDDKLLRLSNSLEDVVDGGRSRCFTTDEAGVAFAKAELERLDMSDVTVTVQDLPPINVGEGKCGWFIPPYDGGGVLFSPGRYDDPLTPKPAAVAMRHDIAEQCLTLPKAEAAVKKITGTAHHWPTSSVEDNSLKCTEIDLVIGGSQQVFLRGPRT